MAEVRLDIDDVQHDGFPPVCAACGAPATEYRRRWFIWTPGRNIPFALLGTWRYNRVTLEVPFCASDRHYFTRRWVPLFAVGLLAIVAGVAVHIATDIRHGKAQASHLDSLIIPAVFGVLAVLFLIGWVMKRNSIRVVDVEGSEFTFAGVSDGFAATIESGPRSAAAPVVLAADDEPPVVTAADEDPPMVRPVSKSPRGPNR